MNHQAVKAHHGTRNPAYPTKLLRPVTTAFLALTLVGCASMGGSNHGLVSMKSPHSAADTMARLEAQVKQRGSVVVARVDHAAGAARVGKTLRPTEVIVFGNPQSGTPLMECVQRVGIDLPMKALVWVDASSQVWVGYNDPAYLVRRNGGGECPAADSVRKALAEIAAATIAP